MSRLIAIGDIHGCSAALAALLEAIGPQPTDRLVFLGDYVDRGPDTRGVVNQLIALADRCTVIPLLGNHEEMMLLAIEGRTPLGWWLQCGGRETLASYDYDGDLRCISAEHRDWLSSCRSSYEAESHIFVHANYVATEPLDHQPAEALRWQSLAEHLPGPHCSGKQAIVGHTSQKSGELLDAGHVVCIDTYCYGGGWLSALEVTTGELWQSDPTGKLRR